MKLTWVKLFKAKYRVGEDIVGFALANGKSPPQLLGPPRGLITGIRNLAEGAKQGELEMANQPRFGMMHG